MAAPREVPEWLVPPGVIVNRLRGDAAETRAHGWLAWDGGWDLDVAVLGIPFDGASAVRPGARHGPDAVREALALYTTYSSATGTQLAGLRAADVGDVRVVATDMAQSFTSVREAAAMVFGSGIVGIFIGGDHSMTWPILEALTTAYDGRHVGVIHFDEHHDLRESHFGAESSGVPFRKALNFPRNPVLGRNLAQIGMGEFANSPVHADYAASRGVTVIPALEVFERGIDDCVDRALARAADGTEAIYLSVDVDVIDQSQAPGTAAPNAYGLDARQVYRAVRAIGAHPKVVGMDVAEISPPFDQGNMTGNVGAMLVLSFMAGIAERDGQRPTADRAAGIRPSDPEGLLPPASRS
jgi:formimidoylglutamase